MTRTLVVDDDADVRDFVALVLNRAGHEVSTAGDGVEALELLANVSFDLVVVDHHMPFVCGAEVVVHLARPEFATKTVLMSGDHTVPSLTGVLAAAPCFLPKPFDRKALISTVEGLIGIAPRAANG